MYLLRLKNHIPGGIATMIDSYIVQISQEFFDKFYVRKYGKNLSRHSWYAPPLEHIYDPIMRRFTISEIGIFHLLQVHLSRSISDQPQTIDVPTVTQRRPKGGPILERVIKKLESFHMLKVLQTNKQTIQTNKQTRNQEQRTMSSNSDIRPSAPLDGGASAISKVVDKQLEKAGDVESSFIEKPSGAPTETVNNDEVDPDELDPLNWDAVARFNRKEVMEALRKRKEKQEAERGKI